MSDGHKSWARDFEAAVRDHERAVAAHHAVVEAEQRSRARVAETSAEVVCLRDQLDKLIAGIGAVSK